MGGGVAGRLQAIFSKMLQLSPRLNSTERLSLIFQSIHYLLCSYSSLSHREGKKKKIGVKGALLYREGF